MPVSSLMLSNSPSGVPGKTAWIAERRQIHRVVALRIIAGSGRGGMNPRVLSGPDLIAKIFSRLLPRMGSRGTGDSQSP